MAPNPPVPYVPPMLLLLLLACGGAADGRVPARGAPAASAVPATPPQPAGDALVLPRAPKNVLMVSIDTLRRDRISRYGKGEATPFVDSLLAGGLALDDHRSCSNWTMPAVLCALAGRDPEALGYFPEGTFAPSAPKPAGVQLLGSLLGQAGFSTGVVSANPLFGVRSGYGADFGQAQTGMYDAATVATRGKAMLADLRATGKPWFLHLHFIDPHSPYRPPTGYTPPAVPGAQPNLPMQGVKAQWPTMDPAARAATLQSLDALYTAEIRYTDDTIRALFGELDAQGALDETLVVLWSDHGEQFQDHGAWEHGEDLHDEETGALGGFWMKGMKPVAWTGPTTHTDLAPTIYDALGLPAPVGFTGLVVGHRPADGPRFAEVLKGQYTLQSVDSAGWRLLYGWDGSMRLYHRAVDPGETKDLYTPEHPEGKRLWALLEPQVARLAAVETRVKPTPPGAQPPADMGPAPWSGGGTPATEALAAGGTGVLQAGGRGPGAAGGAGGAGGARGGMGPPADLPSFTLFEGSRTWKKGTWRGTPVWVTTSPDSTSWVAIRVDEAAGGAFWLVRAEMVVVAGAAESKALPAGTGTRGFPSVGASMPAGRPGGR